MLRVTHEGKIELNRLPGLLGGRSGDTATSPSIERFILGNYLYEIGSDGQLRRNSLPPMALPDSSAPRCCGREGPEVTIAAGGRVLIKNLLPRGRAEYVYYDVNGGVLCTILGVTGKSRAWICPDGEHLLITPGNGDPAWVQDGKGTVLLQLQHHVFDALFWNGGLITYQCLSDDFPEAIYILGAPSVHKDSAIIAYDLDWKESWRREYHGYWFQPVNVRFNAAWGRTYVLLRGFRDLGDSDAIEDSDSRESMMEDMSVRESEGATEPRPPGLLIVGPDGAVLVDREIEVESEYYPAPSRDSYYENAGGEIRIISVLDGGVEWSQPLGEHEIVKDVEGSRDGELTAALLLTIEPGEGKLGVGGFGWEVVVFHKDRGEVFRQHYAQASWGISMSFSQDGHYVVVKDRVIGVYMYGLGMQDQ